MRSAMMRACVMWGLVAPALGGCASAMARARGTTAGPETMVMPALFKMPKDVAVAALAKMGFHGELAWDDQLCGSVVDGQIVETGEVCRQQPLAGREVSTRSRVSLLLQREDPRHGHVREFGEWHLMPAVVGMALDEARATMLDAGFTDGHNRIDYVEEAGCQPMRVCRSYPVALERANQGSDRVLTVGAEPPPPAGDGGQSSPAEPPPSSYF